jgi:hypothetical protein
MGLYSDVLDVRINHWSDGEQSNGFDIGTL